MKIGIIATSRKKHERRLPLHPKHLHLVNPALETPTIQRAVEILDGHILNPAILEFQQRAQAYTYSVCQDVK